jgi:biotin synthesis protein BioG
MKNVWIDHQNRSKLLLVFLGWGMDENILKHLKPCGYDVLAFYDYRDLDFSEDISMYDEIYAIAWSMGVLVLSLVGEALGVQKSIAINGTQSLIDVEFGINPKMYQRTLDGLSVETRDMFFANMFDEKTSYQRFLSPLRDLCEQKIELEFLQNLALSNEVFDFNFDCAIISSRDKIIPTKNQKNFWQTKKVKVVELNCGHYPFFEFENLEEIVNEAL